MAENKTPDQHDIPANPDVEVGSATPQTDAEPGTPLAEPDLIAKVVQTLIGFLGIRARVDVAKEKEGYLVNIRTRYSRALLIGHRGSTLRALQHLTRSIVHKVYPDVPAITLDIGGYRQRRENFLRRKATAVAKIVMETKREMALDLLTEKELAVVQEALASQPGVRVYTVGTGSRRNTIIAPAQPEESGKSKV
ncbi:MAG: hypothetical protein ABIK44_00570 [candidate division WOR-3 bacterium]